MIPYIHYLELIAFIMVALSFKKITPVFLKWLVLLLGVNFLNDAVFIPYVKMHRLFPRNVAYNAYSIMEITVWFYIYYHVFRRGMATRIILIVFIMVIGYSFLELSLLKGWHQFHTDSYRIYELCMITFASMYLYQLLKLRFHRLYNDALFWLSCANLIAHSILFVNLTTIAEKNYWNLENATEVFRTLNAVGNTFFYSLISIGFLSCFFYKHQTRRKTSSQELLPGEGYF